MDPLPTASGRTAQLTWEAGCVEVAVRRAGDQASITLTGTPDDDARCWLQAAVRLLVDDGVRGLSITSAAARVEQPAARPAAVPFL